MNPLLLRLKAIHHWGFMLLAFALLCIGKDCTAQSYPNKPIKVINPWTAGGPADIVARPILNKLSERLGQAVVMENKAGANGVIGSAYVAKAAPDGYTLLFSHVGPIAISPSMQKDMPYNSITDFEPITQVVSAPTVLLVMMTELATESKGRFASIQYSVPLMPLSSSRTSDSCTESGSRDGHEP